MKQGILLLFILLQVAVLGGEFVQDDLLVAINRYKGKELYIKPENGSMVIEVKTKDNKYLEREIRVGGFIHIELDGDSIEILGKKVKKEDSIWIYKGSPRTMLMLGKDNKKYSRYRGDFQIQLYKGNLLAVNSIESEDYIYSSVPSEIGHYFPEEAIKAQALAARSYLYNGLINKKYKDFDLFDNVNSQMYLGYDRESKKVSKIIDETRGEVILYKGKPINALYYSTSGGLTADSEDAWEGVKVPYLRSVKDKGNEERSPMLNWTINLSLKEISKKFKFSVKGIKVLSYSHKRVTKIRIEGKNKRESKIVSGDKFRSIMGYGKVYSTFFKVKKIKGGYKLVGHGSGHGVGMSQYGAYGLASKNYSYKEIIHYYYTDVKIDKYNRK